jgi:membrane protease YdiL (CAAX protease family)
VLACVAAPIVEETMFRGVLFRHLREMGRFWPRFGALMFAAVVNSLIFAAIHPQGLVGIPVLMTLGIAFSIVRHYRDSLLAPMAMHAVNNFVVTMFVLLMAM